MESPARLLDPAGTATTSPNTSRASRRFHATAIRRRAPGWLAYLLLIVAALAAHACALELDSRVGVSAAAAARRT